MSNQKIDIQYTTSENTEQAKFKVQDSFFIVSKTDKGTYINGYNYKEKAMCSFIGNGKNLQEFKKGLEVILNDEKLNI